jgi:hypothetical protein
MSTIRVENSGVGRLSYHSDQAVRVSDMIPVRKYPKYCKGPEASSNKRHGLSLPTSYA